MTTLATHLANARRVPPPLPVRTEQSVRDSLREIIRSRAHGNIRLQLGQWYTREDVDGWRESFKAYRFGD